MIQIRKAHKTGTDANFVIFSFFFTEKDENTDGLISVNLARWESRPIFWLFLYYSSSTFLSFVYARENSSCWNFFRNIVEIDITVTCTALFDFTFSSPGFQIILVTFEESEEDSWTSSIFLRAKRNHRSYLIICLFKSVRLVQILNFISDFFLTFEKLNSEAHKTGNGYTHDHGQNDIVISTFFAISGLCFLDKSLPKKLRVLFRLS